MVGQGFFGPGFADDIDSLVEPFPARIDVDPHAVEFLALVAGADAEVEAAAANDINHRGFFSNHDWIVQGQHNYGGADADILGPSGYETAEGPDP